MSNKEVSKKKIRLSVPLSETMYKRVEEEAALRGISMPTYVAFLIGDHFASYDKLTKKALDGINDTLIQNAKQGESCANDFLNNNPEEALKLFKEYLESYKK